MSNSPDQDAFDPDKFSPERLLKSLFDDEAEEEKCYQIETYDLNELDSPPAGANIDPVITGNNPESATDVEEDFFDRLHRESNPYQEEQ